MLELCIWRDSIGMINRLNREIVWRDGVNEVIIWWWYEVMIGDG